MEEEMSKSELNWNYLQLITNYGEILPLLFEEFQSFEYLKSMPNYAMIYN